MSSLSVVSRDIAELEFEHARHLLATELIPRDKLELLQGTVDLLILRTLSSSSLHGWDIAKRVALVSNDRLSLKQGSLYPALHRLEKRGWIEAEWGTSGSGRSAKFYRLTNAGREEFENEKAHWLSFATAVNAVLNMEEERGVHTT